MLPLSIVPLLHPRSPLFSSFNRPKNSLKPLHSAFYIVFQVNETVACWPSWLLIRVNMRARELEMASFPEFSFCWERALLYCVPFVRK